MVNKVVLLGYLGKDPEVRSTSTGRPVATVSLATSRKWTNNTGEKQEETEWHRVVVWGRQAEVAGQYLKKGKMLYVEGRLQTRSWEDQHSGEKRYSTEVVCENFQMVGGGGRRDDPPHPAETAPASSTSSYGSTADEDDDIPF